MQQVRYSFNPNAFVVKLHQRLHLPARRREIPREFKP
jgi:hypothetical protein